ncbi:MAG: ATP synthase F1 subunit delta [Candidatus Falkowbacteria bacterium]
MKISVQQYAQSLYETVKGESEAKVKELLHNFVALLGRNRDLSLEPAICQAFSNIWNKENGEVVAKLTSARELGKESRTTVVDYLTKKSGAKNVILEETIDPKILGGFILKYNNKIIDGSLRSSLSELKGEMKG